MKKTKKVQILIMFLILSLSVSAIMFFTVGAEDVMPQENILFSSEDASVDFAEFLPEYMENVTRPSQGDDNTVKGKDISALKVTSNGQISSATIHYRNVVDLSYLTKSDTLLEVLVAPETPAPYITDSVSVTSDDYEFRCLDITLTDIYDASNFVTITLERRPDFYYQTSARVQTREQQSGGWVPSRNYMQYGTWGTPLRGSLTGSPSNANTLYRALAVSFDFEESAVYAAPDYQKGGNNFTQVRGLKDPRHLLSGDELWNGFTTGEVTMSITMRDIRADNGATLFILSVAGNDITGETLTDTQKPIVRENSGLKDNRPCGEVGKPFPFFDVEAYDFMDGQNIEITRKAFLKYGTDGQRAFAENGDAFIPDEAGTCSIVYTATDRSGNFETYVIDTEIYTALNPLTAKLENNTLYDVDDSILKYHTGDVITIPRNISVQGGAGSYNIVCGVFKTETGEEIDITENATIQVFSQGYYTISYSISDYLSNETYIDKLIYVYERELPLIDPPYIPSVAMKGKKFFLPDYSAEDLYSFGTSVAAKKIYLVTENDVAAEPYKVEAGTYYTPSANAEKLYVRFYAENVVDKSLSYTSEPIEVYLIDPTCIADYFYAKSGNIQVEYTESGDPLFTTNEDASMFFINALRAELSLSFLVPKEKKNFDITFTLQDSEKTNQRVTITLADKSGGSDVFVNGNLAGETTYAYDISTGHSLDFRNGILTVDGVKICNIEKTVSGEKFNSFSSGKIFLEISFGSVSDTGGIVIKSLNNQSYLGIYEDDSFFDFTTPVIDMTTELKIIQYVGDIVTIPAARAYDVLDPETSLTVKVTNKNGDIIYESDTAEHPYTFRAEMPDKYTVRYTVSDTAGNTAPLVYTIRVLHTLKPVLTLSGNVPLLAKKGESISLPAAEAKDALGNKLKDLLY